MPADGGEIPLERFAEAIDERTALVAVTAVCFRNGARLPIEEIVELAHARGALVLPRRLPGGRHYPLDVEALGVDFLAAGVLKYLLASAGLGVPLVPARPRRAADADADGLVRRPRHLRDGHPRLLAVADRDALRVGHAAGARDLRRASPGMELMEEIGIAATREHVNALNERLIAGVDELGGIVATPREAERRGALVCIRSTDPPALVRALGDDGIVVSERADNLRVSLHAYNTEDDVDALLAALAAASRAARDGDRDLRNRGVAFRRTSAAMLLREVGYARPTSVDEALGLLAESAGARALAGGQTLLNVMKARIASPEVLVDLNGVDELQGHRARRGRQPRDRRDDDLHGHRRERRGPRAADPRRGLRADRRRAGAQPRHDRRQPLRERPDEPPAAADGRARRADDDRRPRRRARRSTRRTSSSAST